MIRSLATSLLAIAVLLTVIGRASAWNYSGHNIIALLAYQALDGATQQKLQAILTEHPHAKEYLTKKIPGATGPESMVMNAATWPDWVRSNHTKRYHRGTWHYVNKPYIVVEMGDTKTRDQIEAIFSDPKRSHGDILSIIPKSGTILKAPAMTQSEKEERAVHLCWLFHLVGDLHQPMHAVALCNKQLPEGDRGGNSLWVTPKKDQAPKNLHAVWDDMLGNEEDVSGIVRDIQTTTKVDMDQRKVKDPNAWADESLALAKTKAYTFQGKTIEFVINTTQKGPSSAPELPGGYHTDAVEVARSRVTIAGARLADLLKEALE